MLTTGRILKDENKDPPENFALYKVGPPGYLVDKKHAQNIHQILTKIEDRVNRHFSKRKTGRIRCNTADYKIYISRKENSLIIHASCKDTGRVLLSHRIRTGESIIV